MYKTHLHKAIKAVPEFGNRISLFTKKLRLAQYADSTIYSYRLKISQAVLYLGKLPDDFTQEDIDRYLSAILDRNRYSMSFFKHTVFGLKEYYKVMGIKEPGGLVLPRVRKPKRLPRVLSQQQVALLLHRCDLYDKTLLSTIYDCALRVSEACSLKWIDISFDRQQLFVYHSFLSVKSYLLSEELSLTWLSAGLVLLAAMSRCVPSAGICISAITAVATGIVPSVRTRSVSSGLSFAGKRLSLSSTSMSFSRYLHVCIPLRWPISGSSTTVPKDRKKKSYLDICDEKGWNIGFCEACCCQRIIMRIIKPAPRAPPFVFWHLKD